MDKEQIKNAIQGIDNILQSFKYFDYATTQDLLIAKKCLESELQREEVV